MHIITIWNKTSLNYGANEFVRTNGTETVRVESEDVALRLMISLISCSEISKAILDGTKGCLTWEEHMGSPCNNCDASNLDCDTCDYNCYDDDDDEDGCGCI